MSLNASTQDTITIDRSFVDALLDEYDAIWAEELEIIHRWDEREKNHTRPMHTPEELARAHDIQRRRQEIDGHLSSWIRIAARGRPPRRAGDQWEAAEEAEVVAL